VKTAEDLVRLYQFILERDPTDWELAERALESIRHAISAWNASRLAIARQLPTVLFLRELVSPFSSAGYVALFESKTTST
jgi:hypothetical protein